MTRSGRVALLLAAIALAATSARGQEPFVERIPNAYRDLTRSPAATQVPLTGEDDSGVQLLIGFPFTFYGQTFTQLGVTTEGYLTFGSAVSSLNTRLPQASPPDGVVAPFWDDLDMRGAQAKVLIERTGAAGARALVVQWEQVALKADPAARLSFQVVLFEGGSEAHLLYGDMRNGDGSRFTGRAGGSSATIGFEAGDGQRAVQLAFNQAGALTPTSAWALVTSPALPEGRLLGDLDGDGRVSILDQSRQVELDSPRYRPGTTLELVAADVAPQSSNGVPSGDGRVDDQDRDVVTLALVDRVGAWPYLSATLPASPAVGETLTLTGSGFDPSAASRNVVVLTRTGGGTLELPAATVNAQGSRLTVVLPAEARRGPVFVRTGGQRTHARTLGVRAIPAVIAVAPPVGLLGQTIQVKGTEFPSALGDVQVAVGGLPAGVLANTANTDGTRTLVVQVPAGLAPGSHPVAVTALGVVGEPAFHRFGDLPIAALITPTADQQVGDLLEVRGTATDPTDFASYELVLERLAPGSDESDRRVIASGTAAVVSGTLGTLDPTNLINGFYALELSVRDTLGAESVTRTEPVQIVGDQKVGVYALSFMELQLSVVGIPVVVARSYDSREKRSQDFGCGWRLTVSSVELEEDARHNVYINRADGKRSLFRFNPEPTSNPTLYRVRFTPEPGVYDALTVPGVQDLFLNFGRFFTLAGEEFDPQSYVLTLKAGVVLELDDQRGLTRWVDLNGNQVTFSEHGIAHSAGPGVSFARDTLGRVTRITDPEGGELRYTYDARGDLTSATSRRGAVTRFVYGQDHDLREIVDPLGVSASRTEFDAGGRLSASVDPDGNRTTYTYDVPGRRHSIRDPLGGVTTFEHDARGLVTLVRDALGGETRYEHDSDGHQIAVVNALGHRTTRSFDGRGNLLVETDPLGHSVQMTYDSQGRVTSFKDGLGNTTTLVHDSRGNLESVKDPLGHVTRVATDAHGNLVAATDPLGNTTQVEHDSRGLPRAVVDPLGNRTEYDHDLTGDLLSLRRGRAIGPSQVQVEAQVRFVRDAGGLVLEEIDGLGNRERVERDLLGRPLAVVDAEGRRTVFAYDDRGYLTSTTAPDGSVVREEFDALGRRTAVIDEAGRRTSFIHDPLGRLVETRHADGTAAISSYDALGRETLFTSPGGATRLRAYDAAGRVTEDTDALGNSMGMEYDAANRVTALVDQTGQRTVFHYDAAGQLARAVYPGGSEISYEHDALGRTTAVIDADGQKTRYEYDRGGRMTALVDGAGGRTQFGYDTVGRLVARTDPLGRVTRFGYDPAGRLTTVTRPLGMTQTLAYDGTAQITTFTTFTGETISYVRDRAARIGRKVFSSGRTIDYTYTATGDVETVQDSDRGLTRYRYAALTGRLIERQEPTGESVAFGHDVEGRRSSVTTSAGTSRLTFDGVGRLETVTSPAGDVTRYAYDARGLEAEVFHSNGLRTTYERDDRGRLVGARVLRGADVLASYSYGLAPSGLRTSVTEGDGTVTMYAYDEARRLVGEARFAPGASIATVTSLQHDAAGNRVRSTVTAPDGTVEETTFVIDANDRVVEETTRRGALVETVTTTFDAAGSPLVVTRPSGTTTFTWTPDRHLATAALVASGQTTTLRFVYDHQGNRVERWRNGVGTRYVLDEGPVVEVLEEREISTGNLLAAYVHGKGVVEQNRGAQQHVHLKDGQGSTRLLADSAAQVTDTYDYDAWGQLLARTGTSENRFKYTTEENDPDLGLYHLRARYYDTARGRFLSEDSQDRDGSSYNKYLYTRGNPVGRRDPTGNFTLVEASVALGVQSMIRDMYTDLYLAPLAEEAYAGAELLSMISEENELTFDSMTEELGLDSDETLEGDPIDDSPLYLEEDPDEHAEEALENCFLRGHMAETSTRGRVPVDEVRSGDRVPAPPLHGPCPNPRCGEVLRTFRGWTNQVVTVTSFTRPRARESHASGHSGGEADGEDAEPPSAGQTQLRCTPGHPFFVRGRGEVLAIDLRAGDELTSPDSGGVDVVVVAVEVKAERAETFNFEVACHHTYWVAAAPDSPLILVHNKSWAFVKWALKILVKGARLELAGRRWSKGLGERVISAKIRSAGGAVRAGFDWLSIQGTGAAVKLVVNEGKNYKGAVPSGSFTVFGLGKKGVSNFNRARDAAEKGLAAALKKGKLTQQEFDTLKDQLDNATFEIRLVGRSGPTGTAFTPASIQKIQQVTGVANVTQHLISVP